MLKKLTSGLKTSAAINSLAGMIAGAFRPLISIITLPLLSNSIGPEMIGFWMSALALTAVFSCVNTGVSTAVVTAIGNMEAPENVVRNGAAIAFVCSAIALTIGLSSILLLDYHSLFQIPDSINPPVVDAVIAIVFVTLAIGFPGQLGRFVAIGKLEGYKAQGIDMLALMVGPIALILAIYAGLDVVAFAAAFILLPVIVTACLSAIYLARGGMLRAPNHRYSQQKLKTMVLQAVPMAAHQGLLAAAQHGDVLIVGILIGPVEAGLYGVGQRLCTLANFFITPINHAFWPELTTLMARGDTRKLRQYFYIQLTATMAFAVMFVVSMATLGNFVIRFWMGPTYLLGIDLLTGLATGIFAFTLMTTMETLLRAQERFGFLLRWTAIGVICATAIKALMAIQLGAAGVAWAGTIVMVLLVGIPYTVAVFRSEAFSEALSPDEPESR